MNSTNWKLTYARPALPPALTAAGYPPLLTAILGLKGIDSAPAAQSFLCCGSEQLFDPTLMLDMDRAAARIRQAIAKSETVAVYGDYDVDGITSTCLVTDWLRSSGLDAVPYIPDRIEEGYGLNTGAIDILKNAGVSLIITVDCGITAVAEAEYALSLGIDMIITDHHECRNQALPKAAAVVDPKRAGCPYPNKELAGVGVALKLVCAAGGNCPALVEKYADLVAVGTVADVMRLTGENRVLVKKGLDKIASSPSVGIAALLEVCGLGDKKLTASSIGFTLAPRLNAAGRLGKASTAARLLMASDAAQAAELAEELCDLNRRRQTIETGIWREANSMLSGETPSAPIVLASESWHQGVIGIAASRLAEQYSLPAIMICLDGDKGKGSCRSYGGFNLFDALSACSDCLEGFGGHALAAGLTIKKDRLDDFRAELDAYYSDNPPVQAPELGCDLIIEDPSLLDMTGVESLDELEPYGNGNPRPTLCFTDAAVKSAIPLGGGKHMRLKISFMGECFECIYFSCPQELFDLGDGQRVDVAFTPQINEFRGRRSVQLVVSGLRLHEPQELCSLIAAGDKDALWCAARYLPERGDFVQVWRRIKSLNAPLAMDMAGVAALCPEDMPPEVFFICLSVWLELGLLTPGPEGKIYGAAVNPASGKVELGNSSLLKTLRQFSEKKD